MPVLGLQMDNPATINPIADSSYVLALEAQKRGYSIEYWHAKDLFWREGQLLANSCPIEFFPVASADANFCKLGQANILPVAAMDVVFLRQDPPFNMEYIATTHFLELVHPKTLVVNNPIWVRNSPEKLLIMDFPELLPPTMITHRQEQITDFRKQHGDIILKPLFGNGGAGIILLRQDDGNLDVLLELYTKSGDMPIMAQKFLPEIAAGDKRIILIDGKPAGAINRLAAKGSVRSNMHAGGQAVKHELSDKELQICEALAPELIKRDLIFVGIDVIGAYLTEINVTSPTGIQEINRFDNVSLESDIWDAITKRL